MCLQSQELINSVLGLSKPRRKATIWAFHCDPSVECCLLAVMDIDTLGTFTMSKAAFPALKAAKSSCIINISMTLHYGATWYQTHASAAKVSHTKSCLHTTHAHEWHYLVECDQHCALSCTNYCPRLILCSFYA